MKPLPFVISEPRFDDLLRQQIADPETAACDWHVVVLDIAKLYRAVAIRPFTTTHAAFSRIGAR
jgi:hypothetical protein